jgi:hypothetical protein
MMKDKKRLSQHEAAKELAENQMSDRKEMKVFGQKVDKVKHNR